MTARLTIDRTDLAALRPGDRITAIDGHALTPAHVVQAAADDQGTVALVNLTGGLTDWRLYPAQVEGSVSVERDDAPARSLKAGTSK